jgi:hypothetical protein
MKIALLTMSFNNNYGGYLQAYALLSYLKELGHDVELINVQPESNDSKYFIKSFLKKYLLTYFCKKYKLVKYHNKFSKNQAQIEKNMTDFNYRYINPKTDKIFNHKDFDKIVKDKYDAYIVGSDQVWRPNSYRFLDQAFFGFVKNKDAILLSYAPSFGLNKVKFNKNDILKYKENLKRFKAVSVREESGIQICKDNFDIEATVVLDPTMIVDLSYYDTIMTDEKQELNGELLVYILDDNRGKMDIVNRVASQLNYTYFRVNPKKINSTSTLENLVYPSMGYWLKGFKNTKYVVTDSFHGTVFSIIYNKPFIVIGNRERGLTRIETLLEKFGLKNRLVFNDYNESLLLQDIDWKSVNIKLKEMKIFSQNFLQSALLNGKVK